jgi:hypothetical protein
MVHYLSKDEMFTVSGLKLRFKITSAFTVS